jgi:hypothetical protein
MDEETCRRATDPWFTSRTTRKVGLGLPLLQMNAGLSGGGVTIDSAPGKGPPSPHPSVQSCGPAPAGRRKRNNSPADTVKPGSINIIYPYLCGTVWSISTREIKEELGEAAVTDLTIVRPLKEIINENV